MLEALTSPSKASNTQIGASLYLILQAEGQRASLNAPFCTLIACCYRHEAITSDYDVEECVAHPCIEMP